MHLWKNGVQVHFKVGNTIKILLKAPKDRYHITEKWSNIQVQMGWVGVWWELHRGICKDLWGKAQGTSQGPFPHLWLCQHYRSSPLGGQCLHSGYRGTQHHKDIKEAIYIRVNDPSLNRNFATSICPKYRMGCCLIHLPSTSSNPLPHFSYPLHMAHTPFCCTEMQGTAHLVPISYSIGRYVVLPQQQQLGVKPFDTKCHSLQSDGAICGKYNIGKYSIFPLMW